MNRRSRELVLGGQRSGKSGRAELRAAEWLARGPAHRAVLIATATAHDEEMRERIARHREGRARRVPGLVTVEEPVQLGPALARHSDPGTLVVVDCLTLWLTHLLMPPDTAGAAAPCVVDAEAALLHALHDARGPVLLVSNEIGLGVVPMGRETRAFVDALGRLNQEVASVCERVTLMAAGLPLCLKEPS
ncbi:Adenosylcobinamide kinase [Variovorax sp. PBS-H4]|nr:Adenosylcobinamide kinase [Variovorax sp. PBS-H4]